MLDIGNSKTLRAAEIADCYDLPMPTAHENRRNNLVKLIGAGTQVAFAEKTETSAAHVSQMVNGTRDMGDDVARRIESKLALPRGAMDLPELGANIRWGQSMPTELIGETEGAYSAHRFIPLLNFVQAGEPTTVIDDYAKGAGAREVQLDDVMARECGQYTFALEISGKSMLPDFRDGDVVVIDPQQSWGPGDIVIAKLDSEDRATLKKYRARGQDANGNDVFDLVPLNEDYATVRVDRENPGRVIGPVVEHRRRLKRGSSR